MERLILQRAVELLNEGSDEAVELADETLEAMRENMKRVLDEAWKEAREWTTLEGDIMMSALNQRML